jgi:plastin-1
VKKSDADNVAIKDLPPVMEQLRGLHEVLSEEEIRNFLSESYPDMNQSIEFEPFLRVQLTIFAYFLLILHFHVRKT